MGSVRARAAGIAVHYGAFDKRFFLILFKFENIYEVTCMIQNFILARKVCIPNHCKGKFALFEIDSKGKYQDFERTA